MTMSNENSKEDDTMKDLAAADGFDILQTKCDLASADVDSTSEIDCSDDEKYEITTEDMISVYKRIANNDLELCQKLVRVRSPSPEAIEEKKEDVKKVEDDRMEEVLEEKTVVEEFDFDNFTETSKVVTPRRVMGSIKKPRNTQKRVAQWDKIMNDYLKYQKLEEKSEPPKTPKLNPVTPSVTSNTPTTPVVKCLPIKIINDIDLQINNGDNGVPAVAKVEVVSQSVSSNCEVIAKLDNDDNNVIICKQNNEQKD